MELKNLPSMYELCLMHAKADRAMRTAVSEQLTKQNVSLMEWLALNVVCRANREGISMSSIAETLDVTLPQVSALINTLNKLGFVRQKILASDRRGRQVTPTIRGKRALQKLESQVQRAIQFWSQAIPQKQMAAYIQTVEKLAQTK